jgi:hypothetical protein
MKSQRLESQKRKSTLTAARRKTNRQPLENELNKIYGPSQNVVARLIEGELIIVPLTAGIGNMENDFFALDETGKAIWTLLDGKRTVAEVVTELKRSYRTPLDRIRRDVLGFIAELAKRKIIVDISS